MKVKNIIAVAAVGMMLTGCGLYKKYESKATAPANVFGSTPDVESVAGGTSMAQMSWREFFTDPMLQQLIERVLANNTDLNSARIAVEQSEASLKAAKMAYLPSLYLTPQGAVGKFDNNPWAKTYNLQLQMSLDIDVFGTITNKKRAAKAVLMQTRMGEEAVRSNLVSTVAQQYFMLQLLDRQMDILMQTDSLWKASLDTQKSLYENGKAYSTAVNQLEASYLSVRTQIADAQRNIRATENAICKLLAVTPQHIARSHWGAASSYHSDASGRRMFDKQFLRIGVPAQMLENRPDVRLVNYAMEEAYYNTQVARAAFFPNITLSGTLGWTNNGSGAIVNPGAMLFNAVGQLAQPIFNRGSLKANLRISKLAEEDLQKQYVQTVIDAGNEVNEALADCSVFREKHDYYHRQVEVLYQAYVGTHELMDNGKATYLEVLTAQESLLNAQLSEAMNMYNGSQAVIALYIALGGATK